ncbi:MAG: hypothetical protein DRP85_05820 [Candidatus Makaraimicrobium thalassicum]|nr:MAG: hypothetical protein DRP85_05820 [Candidatus Omnitrophota bacterium]
MGKTFFKSIKDRLIVLFLTIALVPIFIIGYLGYQNFRIALEKETFAKLAAVAEIKTTQLEDYFKEGFSDIDVLAQLPSVKAIISLSFLLQEFRAAPAAGEKTLADFIKTPGYDAISRKMGPSLRNYKEANNYNDLLLIDRDGNILYTVERRVDLGTNLKTGLGKDSNLAGLVTRILEGEVRSGFADFEPYPASNNEPAAFIAHAIYDDNAEIHGAVVLYVAMGPVNAIMGERSGLGKTGETYLVGSDYLMRSGARFERASTVLKKKVDTAGVRDIFTRKPVERGPGICKEWIYENYRGIPVLGHNHYLKGLGWAMMAEINRSEAFAPVIRLRNGVLLLMFVITVTVVIMAVLIANRIAGPIKQLSGVAGEVTMGDLTKPISIESSDEIGVLASSFRSMVERLNHVLTRIKDAAGQMTSSSGEILAASQQQAAGASEQSSAISETTSAAGELSRSAEQVGDNIRLVAQAANHVLVGMARMKDAIGKTSQIVTLLGEKSQKIGQIAELIDDVADQTNLLAVNAAIEAARAGEQGRGFTVVADEMRKLSDSTGKSTKDITALIEVIQHQMSNTVMAMEQSMSSVEEEVRLAKETAERAKEISMSVNQQISGSKQIADAMKNIDETMKQVVQGAQQSQSAAKNLTGLAHELEGMAGKFNLKEEEVDSP